MKWSFPEDVHPTNYEGLAMTLPSVGSTDRSTTGFCGFYTFSFTGSTTGSVSEGG